MDINNFGCFDAKVWGNVSDWVMVLVTFATGILIYRTLRSQTKVQESQQESTRIDKFWHRERLRPKFEFTATEISNSSTDEEFIISIKFKLTTLESNALNLKLKFPDSELWRLTILPDNQVDHNPNDFIKFVGEFALQKSEPFKEIYIASLNIEIYYDDADNNSYFLTIDYIDFNGNIYITQSLPKLIN